MEENKKNPAIEKVESLGNNSEKKREEYATEKYEKKQRRKKRKNNNNGLKIATIILASTTLILSITLGLSLYRGGFNNKNGETSTANTERYFYDFVGYVDNMETTMSKVLISSDSQGQERLLGDIMVQSNLADSSLGALPIKDESKYYTSKYINQVGDFCKYLHNKLIRGERLSESDFDTLESMYEISVNLKESLLKLSSDIDETYDFSALENGDADDLIISSFTKLEDNAVSYPEMIYDGAFSDGIENKTAKGLSGEDITEDEAVSLFSSIFEAYDVENVECVGMTENGIIDTYNIVGDTENGQLYAQFTVKGGHLIAFNSRRNCMASNLSEDEAEEYATAFLSYLGIDGMECVWKYTTENSEYLNFAYSVDDVIFYPDLIKLHVCRETGRIIGMDADNYYMSHIGRENKPYDVGESEAYDKVSKTLQVLSVNKAVIPLGAGSEKYAYEVVGSNDGDTYYVYLDGNNLQELEIYKVVETDAGRLLV